MKYIILLTVFAFSNISFGQNVAQFRDSIKIEISKLPSDSLKASLYYDSASHVIRKLGDLKLYRIYTDSSMYFAKASEHKDLEAKSHFAYGLLERLEGNYELALEHLETNINYFKNDSVMKPYAMFQVGVIHRQLGDYKKSLETYFEILKIFEHNKDSMATASTLNSIANLYGELDKYDDAILNFTSANSIFINKGLKRDVSNTTRNIATMYLRKLEINKSRKYAYKSLTIAKEIENNNLIGSALNALGETYLESDVSLGLQYFLNANQYLEKSGYNVGLIAINKNLGFAYNKLNNYSKSIQYYNKALEISKKNKVLPESKRIYSALAEIYGEQRVFDKAYFYQQKYIEANDSLLNSENAKNLNLLQKQFESEKKSKELIQQQLQIEQKDKEIQKKKTQYNYMTGVAIFSILAAILIWFLFQQRQKRKNQEIVSLKREHQIKTLESLIEGEEKERFRIAKELHDGVNGDLSAIKFKLSSLLDMNNEVIKEAVAMIDKSYEQVRAISHNLIPPALEDFELIETLDNFCHKIDDNQEINVTFQHVGDAFILPKKDEVNIFRIVQELVSNSIKHAEATEINVQLSSQDNSLQITVDDNGKGFDKETVKGDGIGLENVQSRVEYLNASVDFSSNDRGTSYIIEIDLDKTL